MPVPGGVEHRKAPERLPDAARTPWELRISRRSVGFRFDQTPWGAGSRHRGSPRCSGLKRARGKRGRKSLRRAGDDVLRRGPTDSGTTYAEPGRAGSSAFEALELSTSYSSEFEVAEHQGRKGAADAAMRHGLTARKRLNGENPRSGSGPSVSARPEGEQPVEGARNPEDGRRRARQTRCSRSLRRCR